MQLVQHLVDHLNLLGYGELWFLSSPLGAEDVGGLNVLRWLNLIAYNLSTLTAVLELLTEADGALQTICHLIINILVK